MALLYLQPPLRDEGVKKRGARVLFGVWCFGHLENVSARGGTVKLFKSNTGRRLFIRFRHNAKKNARKRRTMYYYRLAVA